MRFAGLFGAGLVLLLTLSGCQEDVLSLFGKDETEKFMVEWFEDGAYQTSEWMQEQCISKGMRLCTYREICPNRSGLVSAGLNRPYEEGELETPPGLFVPFVDAEMDRAWTFYTDCSVIYNRASASAYRTENRSCGCTDPTITALHPDCKASECCGDGWCTTEEANPYKRVYSCCGVVSVCPQVDDEPVPKACSCASGTYNDCAEGKYCWDGVCQDEARPTSTPTPEPTSVPSPSPTPFPTTQPYWSLSYHDDGNGKSGMWMAHQCEARNLKLCTYNELCPTGGGLARHGLNAPNLKSERYLQATGDFDEGQGGQGHAWVPYRLPDGNRSWLDYESCAESYNTFVIGKLEDNPHLTCECNDPTITSAHPDCVPSECCGHEWCTTGRTVPFKYLYACCGEVRSCTASPFMPQATPCKCGDVVEWPNGCAAGKYCYGGECRDHAAPRLTVRGAFQLLLSEPDAERLIADFENATSRDKTAGVFTGILSENLEKVGVNGTVSIREVGPTAMQSSFVERRQMRVSWKNSLLEDAVARVRGLSPSQSIDVWYEITGATAASARNVVIVVAGLSLDEVGTTIVSELFDPAANVTVTMTTPTAIEAS